MDSGMQPETERLKRHGCHLRGCGDIPRWGPRSHSLWEAVWKSSGIAITALFRHYSWGIEFELKPQLAWRMKVLREPVSARAEPSGPVPEFPRIRAHHSSHFILFLFGLNKE